MPVPIPLLSQVHRNNHTQVNRKCSIAAEHYSNANILKTITYKKNEPVYNLNAGLYKVSINGKTYIFDLYETLSGSDYLNIVDNTYAYIMTALKIHPIIMYEYVGAHALNQQYKIADTVNDAFDMIVVDGFTEIEFEGDLLQQTVDHPANIKSISSLTFNTAGDIGEDSLTIKLHTNIKSLPNGTKDILIMDSELQQFHIIYNIGRYILTGYENWEVLSQYSDDQYTAFIAKDENVKLQNATNNLWCSHFPVYQASSLISKSFHNNAIATSYGSIGNGFLLKISRDLVDPDKDELAKYLRGVNKIKPIIVEYPTSQAIYKSVLLDEYHVKTFFPNTTIKDFMPDRSISFFYKHLHV